MTLTRDKHPQVLRWLVGRAAWLAVAIGLSQLACQASPPATPASQAHVAAVQPTAAVGAAATALVANRYDLEPDEGQGGHTLSRHVGLSDADLSNRLRREPKISAASTYTDRATAERVVLLTLARHRSRVDQWLARQGPRPNLALDYQGADDEPIGRSLTRRSRQAVPCSDAVVVLRWAGRREFYVLTSYPELSR